MPEVIGPKLDLVFICGQLREHSHDASVADEYVEALGGEFLHAGFDRGERGEVTLDEGKVGSGHDGCDFADDFVRFMNIPAAEINFFDCAWPAR